MQTPRRRPARRVPPGPINMRPPAVARTLALELLVAVANPRSPGLDKLLDTARREQRIAPRDFALAQEIAYGVCRRRLWLEDILGRHLHKPLPKSADEIREALLMGLYQLLYLDRVPSHAIVDETVRLIGSRRTEKGYRGLANAILRKVSEVPREQLLPDAATPWPLAESVPAWLASETGHLLPGGQAQAFFAACNETAPLNLRIRSAAALADPDAFRDKLRTEVVDLTAAVPETMPGRFLPDCLHLRGRGVIPSELASFQRGDVTAEDEAAQFAGYLCGAKPGQSVLDLCAAPGGKTSHLADAMRCEGRLLASDLSTAKLIRLSETLQRLNLSAFVERRLAADVHSDESLTEAFDMVLVDAPCSGLGTLRRHPEIRWRRGPKDIRALAKEQLLLLRKSARMVRPGGHLVYSVCTFTPLETDRVAADFLASMEGTFRFAPAPEGLPVDASPYGAGEGRWRTWPHRDGCDGFFVARFVKG